MLISRLANLS